MKRYISVLIILIALIGLVILYRYSTKPVKIGYSSGTTGPLAEVGVDARNSFMLRIKEANDAGGVNGRTIEMVIIDDQNDPAMIPAVHDQMEAQGVRFVVGHIISALDEAVLEEAEEDRLILSASMSSAKMDGIDDNFIRLASSYTGQVIYLTDHMESGGTDRLSIIYDVRNEAYSKGFYEKTAQVYSGEIVQVYSIGGDGSQSHEEIVSDIKDTRPDGVLMVTPASETALFCQHMTKEGVDVSKYGVSWSMTNDLFTEGGRCVDGMQFVYVPYSEAHSQPFEDFRASFSDTYGYEPSTICFNTYEMTSVLLEAMERTASEDVDKVKAAIVGHTFEGLTDSLIIDEFGDRQQEFTMYEALDGEFVRLEE